MLTVLLPLLLALLAAPLTALAGLRRPAWAVPVALVTAGLAFGAVLSGWLAGGGTLDLAWAPTWNLHLTFTLDGLAATYALLATGIGLLVVIYSSGYLPHHLEEEEQPPEKQVRFYAFLLLFMGAMVGLVMAQDLLLIFIFWDLTAIASYYLIGYDQHKAESRAAALMALLVTGITSLFFLIGALLLFAVHQTFSLPELIDQAEPGLLLTAAAGFMALAALAKSAQVPFHFWLPQAMVAPTPVSAYLHSAAMVAAGVFLLQRIYPLLQHSQLLLNILIGFGLLSMITGGVLALTRDVVKRILAYSTVAQYGYIVFMLGLGGSAGVAGASFYVIAHALLKSSLFLTAGAVTQATDENRLSYLSGAGRAMPLLAIASGAAAAGLAGLPLTVGFFKDELLFEAALEHGWPFVALALLGAMLTLAYIWRFWSGIFLSSEEVETHQIPAALIAPVVILGLLIIIAGINPGPVARLAEAAGEVTSGEPTPIDLAYHLDARPTNLLALAVYGLGALLIVSRPIWLGLAASVAEAGRRVGPERWYQSGLAGLNRLSNQIYGLETRDLRGRIVTILIPAAILVGIGLLAGPIEGQYTVGSIRMDDFPLILALLLTVIITLIVPFPRGHLIQVIALSGVGYSLAAVFVLFGAPNVALVVVLIGTMFTLLFTGILALLPEEILLEEAARPESRLMKWRDLAVSGIAALFAFVVTWGVLSSTAATDNVVVDYAELAPTAHARNIVAAILIDFRGFDTMGEITVISIALLGVATLLRGRRVS